MQHSRGEDNGAHMYPLTLLPLSKHFGKRGTSLSHSIERYACPDPDCSLRFETHYAIQVHVEARDK